MSKIMKILPCALAVVLLAGLRFLPEQATGEQSISPLYGESLAIAKDQITRQERSNQIPDSSALAGNGALITLLPTTCPCVVTIALSCWTTVCGTTCVTPASCGGISCNCLTTAPTCWWLTGSCLTCGSVCGGVTSTSTCASTCGGGCEIDISLVSFVAETGPCLVTLHWTTASEIENYSFVLYRSINEEAGYQAIAQIPATGGEVTTSYSYTDTDVQLGVTYYYKIADVSVAGLETVHPNIISATPLPEGQMLAQTYPNPFNQTAIIRFALIGPAQVHLLVYNQGGRLVRTLFNDWMSGGLHEITWNAQDDAGKSVPSGIYIYRLQADELSATGKMVLMK